MGQSETERAVGYLVKRVQQALRRSCDAALKPAELSMAQYAVLRALADHPAASASELARLCFVTRQSLQDVLAGLRSSGLVEPADRPLRGRARPLRLTTSGRQRLTAADQAVRQVDAAMLHDISAARRRELAGLLTACADNLENA
jgi:DNA-binding MarR family transcriptional regulator